MGCGFINVLDSENRIYVWGDNYGGQLGTKDDIHREEPCLLKSLLEIDIKQISLGFQHSLYLSTDGKVYGVGKNNRFQLGKRFNMHSENQEIFDKYSAAKQLDYFDEPIISVHAGKFHSLFLGESG